MESIPTEMRARAIALLLLGCASAPLAAATIFKWRDASGHLHYGDRAPLNNDTASERLRVAPPPQPDSGNEGRRVLRSRLLESFARERAAQRAARAKREATRERNQAACARARSRRAALEQAGSVFQTTADGQRVYFNDAQRARLMRNARDAVRKHCE